MTTVTMQKFATQIDEMLGEVENNGDPLLVERDYNSIEYNYVGFL